MTHEEILWKVLETFQKCNVKSFPINCFDLLEQHGYECLEYSELEEIKQQACHMVSDDAFRLNDKVYYNDQTLLCRRRFSLMHELGHIVLEHKAPYKYQDEHEANTFASNILAPRMAIHYSQCKNANDVSKTFRLTHEAATYAFDDYRRWRRTAIHRMSLYDKHMYQHFYNPDKKCFVWHEHACSRCRSILYNTLDVSCGHCKHYKKSIFNDMEISFASYKAESDCYFRIAEQHYLYGKDL